MRRYQAGAAKRTARVSSGLAHLIIDVQVVNYRCGAAEDGPTGQTLEGGRWSLAKHVPEAMRPEPPWRPSSSPDRRFTVSRPINRATAAPPEPARALRTRRNEAGPTCVRKRRGLRSPAEVVATLLGCPNQVYLCSERCIVCGLRDARVQNAGAQRPIPSTKKLRVDGHGRPNEVWSWDITRLLGPKKWSYYFYVHHGHRTVPPTRGKDGRTGRLGPGRPVDPESCLKHGSSLGPDSLGSGMLQ